MVNRLLTLWRVRGSWASLRWAPIPFRVHLCRHRCQWAVAHLLWLSNKTLGAWLGPNHHLRKWISTLIMINTHTHTHTMKWNQIKSNEVIDFSGGYHRFSGADWHWLASNEKQSLTQWEWLAHHDQLLRVDHVEPDGFRPRRRWHWLLHNENVQIPKSVSVKLSFFHHCYCYHCYNGFNCYYCYDYKEPVFNAV